MTINSEMSVIAADVKSTFWKSVESARKEYALHL